MSLKTKMQVALEAELPAMCGLPVYFHNKENGEELSGVYTVASLDLQNPSTETVLLFRDRQQAWVEPRFLQFSTPGRNINDNERVVLKMVDGSIRHQSADVARIMLAIANAKTTQSETVATGKAMEMLQQFRVNKHITNEGCMLMTRKYWEENYA